MVEKSGLERKFERSSLKIVKIFKNMDDTLDPMVELDEEEDDDTVADDDGEGEGEESAGGLPIDDAEDIG